MKGTADGWQVKNNPVEFLAEFELINIVHF